MDAIQSFIPFNLTPLDHAMPPVYVSQFLCFHGMNSQYAIHDLQVGINRLLRSLPLLAGEIFLDEDSGAIQVRPSTSLSQRIPYLVIEAHPDLYLPAHQCAKPAPVEKGLKVTSLDASSCPLPVTLPLSQPQPVLRFKAHILADGVLLAVSYHHCVLDGTGGGKVLEMLAHCCRVSSDEEISIPTDCNTERELRHYFANLTSTSKAIHNYMQDFRHVGFPPDATEPNENDRARWAAPKLRTEPFIFSAKRLLTLRDSCNQIVLGLTGNSSTDLAPDLTTRLSSNDVLTALLGFCISRAQIEDTSTQTMKSTSLTMAINLRPRVQPLGLEHCLGNVTSVVRLHFDGPSNPSGRSDVVLPSSHSLHETIGDEVILYLAKKAFHLRCGLRAMDEEYVRGLMMHLRERTREEENRSLVMPDIIVSSWRHLSVYNLDFGPELGKISNFELQDGIAQGLVVVLPMNQNASASPSWDVRVTLAPNDMERFSKDPLIRWAVQ